MGSGVMPEHGLEIELHTVYAAFSDLGKVALGTHEGIAFLDEDHAPLSLIAIERDDPRATDEKRRCAEEQLQAMGLTYEAEIVTKDHPVIIAMLLKRSHG